MNKKILDFFTSKLEEYEFDVIEGTRSFPMYSREGDKYIALSYRPTGNCQILAVGDILHHFCDEYPEEIIQIIALAGYWGNCTRLLMDIKTDEDHEEEVRNFEKFFNEYVEVKVDYTNGNENPMRLYICDLSKIVDDIVFNNLKLKEYAEDHF